MASSREQALLQEALPGYEVGAELGRGAFGVVYLGRHRQLGREVAIKQLPRAFAADPGVRERFVAEARVVASLDHPHIVPVFDFVDRDDGVCAIVMERCVGAVSDRFQSDGLATDEACAAVLACCAALDHAHRAGVLHRDIKPENLLYDAAGVVKLGDFGIARALDGSARRTATGLVIGTPAYMSPEQVRGEDLTPASDVYSAGIMAYELLSGGFPFEGATSATGLLAHHLVTPPTPLVAARAELPAVVGAVIDRALSKDIADRHQTAEELAVDLTRACVGSFGAGWLRRRRFVLHWPEVIAESERPRDDGARTGTIVVRAADSRTSLAGVRGPDDPPSVATAAPRGAVAPAAPPATPPAPASPIVGAVAAEPIASPGAPAGQPVAVEPIASPAEPAGQPFVPPPAAPVGHAAGGSNDRRLIAVGVVCAALALGLLAFALTRGGGDDDPVAGPDPTSPSSDDGSVGSTDDSGGPGTVETTTVPREQPDRILADSPWTPTPCPVEPELVGCILAGVAVDTDTGEMTVPYQTFGFVPELEPADYHLHFYLDTVVDGDERKAGAQEPGGSWKLWDGLGPFTSFGGENGRTGYTLADAKAEGARHLCVLVAEADHTVLPGTGNCAPIPYVDDPDVALEQVDRLTGVYAGRCAVGATLVLPEDWRWVDLIATPAADAARTLRPTGVDDTQRVIEELVRSGGLIWADGPAVDGFIVNLTVTRVEGAFTAADGADRVGPLLQQAGLAGTGDASVRTFGGREVLARVLDRPEGVVIQYAVPDFGYALVLDFRVPDVEGWVETTDAIAATAMGC